MSHRRPLTKLNTHLQTETPAAWSGRRPTFGLAFDVVPREQDTADYTWFKPEWWRWYLQEPIDASWPPELDQLDPDPEHPGHLRINRDDVFRVAASGGGHRLVRAAVAAYVWGVGKSAFLVGRMVRAFTANKDKIEETLAQVDRVLRTEGAVAAYASMLPDRENHLKFVGPAYFTKHLYFTGYRIGVPGPRPLILDARVVGALSSVDGFAGIASSGWPADTYRKYLEYCDASDREPDKVEAELFLAGRAH